MSAPRQERLHAVLARASSPVERTREWLAPAPGTQDLLAARRSRWERAVAAGDREGFARLLSARGLDAFPLERLVGGARVVGPERLPGWAREVLELAQDLERLGPGLEAAPGVPFPAALGPLLEIGRRRLDGLPETRQVPLAPTARWDLIEHLRLRLLPVLAPSLAFRPGPGDLLLGDPGPAAAPVYLSTFGPGPAGDPPRDPWLALFERYPVLARLLGQVFLGWSRSVRELLGRLARDRELLGVHFQQGIAEGEVCGLKPGLGDPHAGGRSVTLVSFARHLALVYKPRDLGVVAAFQHLVGEVEDPGDDACLKPRKVLPRDGYGWEEAMPREPMADPRDPRRYYFRLGRLLRVLELLEGRDCHAENLLPRGAEPVLVDLEGLLAPRVPVPGRAGAEAAAEHALQDSPVLTGILPAHLVGDPGRPAVDLSVLALPAVQEGPFRRHAGPGGSLVYTRLRVLGALPFWPDGRVEDPAPHFPALLEGYRAMEARLEARLPRLARPGGPLDEVLGSRVRYYHRDTALYARLLRASLEPSCLRDGIDRELVLERLWLQALRAPVPPEIIQAEVDALRDLDVPLFLASPASDRPALPDGRELPAWFDGDAASRLRARVAGRRDLARSTDLVRSSFATRRPWPGERRAPGGAAAAPPVDPARALETASEIADGILAEAFDASRAPGGVGGDRGLAWIGLAYHPTADLWRLERLPLDILGGGAGIAILCAELHGATGLGRYRDAARRCLGSAPREIRALRAEARRLAERPVGPTTPPFLSGACYGSGTLLVALARTAALLADPSLLELARDHARSQPLELVRARSPLDLVSGRAGLLLAFLALLEADPGGPRDIRDLALAQLHDLLADLEPVLGGGEPPAPPYPPGSGYLAILPDTRHGLAWALRRAAFLHPPCAHASASLLAAAPLAAGGLGPGSLAVRIALDTAPGRQAALAILDRRLDREPGGLGSGELLEDAGLALTARDLGGEARYQGFAESRLSSLLGRRLATGSWFPERLAADRHQLSLLRGKGAVARAFLRLFRPADRASALLLP